MISKFWIFASSSNISYVIIATYSFYLKKLQQFKIYLFEGETTEKPQTFQLFKNYFEKYVSYILDFSFENLLHTTRPTLIFTLKGSSSLPYPSDDFPSSQTFIFSGILSLKNSTRNLAEIGLPQQENVINRSKSCKSYEGTLINKFFTISGNATYDCTRGWRRKNRFIRESEQPKRRRLNWN